MSDERITVSVPVYEMPVTREVLWDAQSGVVSDMRRLLRASAGEPWLIPDRNPFPHLDWWPWIDRTTAAATEARERIAAAVDVLRHGAPEDDR